MDPRTARYVGGMPVEKSSHAYTRPRAVPPLMSGLLLEVVVRTGRPENLEAVKSAVRGWLVALLSRQQTCRPR